MWYHFKYTEQKAPGNSQIHRSPPSCGFSVSDCFISPLLGPRILRWILHFLKKSVGPWLWSPLQRQRPYSVPVWFVPLPKINIRTLTLRITDCCHDELVYISNNKSDATSETRHMNRESGRLVTAARQACHFI